MLLSNIIRVINTKKKLKLNIFNNLITALLAPVLFTKITFFQIINYVFFNVSFFFRDFIINLINFIKLH